MKTSQEVIDGMGPDSSFMASGKKWVIHMPDALSIECQMEVVMRSIELTAGTTLKDHIGSLTRMEKLYNDGKQMDFCHEFKNMLYRLGKVYEHRDPLLDTCAIFIRGEDDDLTKVPTRAAIDRAIAAWNDEGIPYSFFVHWLGTFNPLLKVLLSSATPNSSPSREEDLKGTPAPSATSSTSPKSTSKASASVSPAATSRSSKRSNASPT